MKEEGQTLIEVLVGLATLVVIIAAITSITLSALSNATFSKSQNVATSYAQQGMEIMRNMRDANVASISAQYLQNSNYCLGENCSALAPGTLTSSNASSYCWTRQGTSCPQNMGTYIRQVVINTNSTSCNSSQTGNTEADIKVSWYDTQCKDPTNLYCHSVELYSCLSNFNVVPTP